VEYIVSPEHCHQPINFAIISRIFKYEYKLFEDFATKYALLEK
jgi:hypothetical protein